MNLKFSKGLRCLPVLFLSILSFASLQVSAQNCTINAGINEDLCPGTPMVLKGVFSGLISGQANWSQVGGPAVTIGPAIRNGSNINANVTGFSQGNTYTFRITGRCVDGSQVFQDVVFTTLVATKATVGQNIATCPGTVMLSGNALHANETGDWSIITRSFGTILNNEDQPNATLTLRVDTASIIGVRWTIANTNGCVTAATMSVTNYGADPVISAGPDQGLGNCYNLEQSTQLRGSYAGTGIGGQTGTWSFVSGPSIPLFGDIHNNATGISKLITGTYRLRWTVSGPCANGSDEMTITVPPPTQAITVPSGGNSIFCDSRTSTVISDRIPGFTNEIATWTIESGPGTISDIHASSITVTDLAPPLNTRLAYTIHNTVTGCTEARSYNIIYTVQTSIAPTSPAIIVLPSTATAISLPFTYTGGNATYWQIVSNPLDALISPTGSLGYQFIDASPIDAIGLDKIGNYNFRLLRTTQNAGQGGCENAYADITVVISQPPTAANAGTTGSVACNVFSTTLAGNVPIRGSGYWSQVSGPSVTVFSDITAAAPTITNLVSGAYVYRWIVSGGYGSTDAQSDVLVTVANTVPTTSLAGAPQVVCNGTPVSLSGNDMLLNEQGTWTITPTSTETFVNIHDPKTKLTGLADNTAYTLTWTITNACGTSASTTTITTSNTAGPKAAVAGAPQCLSSTATVFNLSGNAPTGTETGVWSFVSGPNTPSITAPSSNTSTVTGVVNGIYKFEWSLSTPTCAATRDTVLITASVAATQATVTTTPINLCNVTSVTLAGNTPVVGVGHWTQAGGPGGAVITDPFSPTSTVTGLASGSYIFRWTISNGACSSNFADVKYNVSAPPTTPTVGPSQELCGIPSTTLTGNAITTGVGLWKVLSGPNTPVFSSNTNPTATLSGLVTGIYKLVWTSVNGANCGISESSTLNITMRENASATAASTGLCNATVALLTGNNGSSGSWTFVSGSGTPTLTTNSDFTAIATGLTNGTYTFKYTIPATGGCVVTSSSTVSVTVTASPSPAQAGNDQVLCSASFATLSADVPAIGTGTWTIIAQPATGAAFANSHSPTTTITTATPGVYLLQWNVTNGFCGTNQDIVRITTSAPPTTSVAGANQLTACSGNLTLIANTPSVGIGTWSQVTSMTGTIDAANFPVTAVLGTIPGAYTFMWTISSGSCPASTSTVDINVSSIPPNPATPGPAQSICNVSTTATATLAGSSPIAGETGVWTIASKPIAASPGITDATLFNTTVTNLVQGEYQFTWTVSNGSCVSSSTVTITVTDQPTPSNPGADQSICLYTPVALHATAVSVGIGTWSVTSQPLSTPEVVFSDVNSPTTDVNGLAAGDYTFAWVTTNGNACATSISNTTVHIVQPPTPALAGSFQTVCLGVNPILAANSPTFGVGAWTVTTSAGGTPAFTPSINANDATVTGLVAGVYTFSWTITNGGCTSDDYVQVTVQPAIGNNEIHTPQTICSGTTAAGLTGTAPTGGDGTTYNYQWQRSTTSDVAGFANIPSATAATYGPGTLTTTTWYRRLVSSGSCSPGTFSNTLEITVQPPLANNVITAPITATFCQAGDPDVITGLSATGGDGVTYNYQWEQSTTSASAGFTAITAATSLDYDPATLTVSTWFRRTVSSGACAFITSPAIKITINPYASLTSLQSLTPICNGTVLTYSPTASIAGTTFTWTRPAIASINGNAAGSGSGAFSETLTSTDVVPVPVTYLYSLTVTGCTNPTAYTVTVNVNPTPTVALPASELVCKGLTTTTVVFTGSPVANTVYNWSIDNTAIGVGLTSTGTGNINSFVTANSSNIPISATITVTPISNTCSGASQSFTIVVNPVAFAVTVAQSVCSGAPFTIAPTNGSGNIIPAGTTYSWSAPTGAANADGAAGSVAANITGTLSHTSNTALTAVYMVTPNTAACGDGPVFSITITVSPVAAITSMSITTCAGLTFYMTPTQTTDGVVPSGTLYSWSAPTITGGLIGAATGTNLNSVRGTVYNTTSAEATATYIVTPKSGTCTGATFVATASILPRAVIISQMTVTTCSGIAFDFTPTDGFGGNIIPTGTTFTWPTPTGTSLTGGLSQATGIDHVFGTFANSSNIARTVQYNIVPLSGACTGVTYSVTATILPIVSIASTTSQFTRVICSGTMFSVTPVNSTNGIVPATTLYRWSAPTTTGTLTGISTSTNSSQITGTLNNPGSTAQTATFIVIPSTSCGDGASFTVIVTVQPMAAITPITTTLCGGTPFSISPTDGVNGIVPAGTLYSWAMPTNSGSYSGGATGSLTGTISATLLNKVNTAVAAVYTVTPTTNFGCIGSAFTVTININPTAQITAMTNVICNGSSFTSTPANIVNNIVPSGSTYTWLAPTGTGFTGGITGTGSSISGTLANSTSTAHTATYIVTPTSGTCVGGTFTITVTVNPIAAVTDMTATTCSGVAFGATPVDVVNGTIPAGTIYTWNAPAVSGIAGGVANSLTSTNIHGQLTNTTIATAVAVYTVTPTSNGCTGAQFTLTVTVEPSAQVTPMSTTVCGGSPFTVIPTNTTDGRVPPATTYSWLALPTPTGVAFTGGATATGAANISGALLNTTNIMRTATYLVTPLTGGCTGAVFSVTVNINPLAQVTSMTTIICSGTTFNLTPVNVVNGIVPTGITYSWTVFSITGGITGAISGSGQTLITGTLLNPTSTQQTATYTVTPNTSTCGDGPAFTVTVSVNPTATVTVPLSLTICGGVAFSITPTDITHGNLPVGTRFSWLAPTGSGFSGGAVGSNALAVTGTIVNTTSTVTTAFYAVTTVSGVCTGAPFTVTVTLNPKAIITQMTGTSCSGTAFTITPTDITNNIVPSGTTYTWTAPTGSNLSGFASGAGADINGTLTNNVNVARTATYLVTPTSVTGNCTGNVFSIVVTIDPRAYITAITNITCSGVAFTVSPTNLTNGVVPVATIYRWNAPSLTGSLTGEASGSGASFISGNLTNTSSVAQTATYTVIPTNACGDGVSFTVTVTVNPSAAINPISTATCSALTFTVTPNDPANGTIPTGTTYTWGVPSVTGGITGGVARGTASATVFGLLTNPTNSVQTATYAVTPLSGNCTGAQFSVTVTLNPKASITAMVATTCNGVAFAASPAQGTNGTVPAGTTYSWGTPTGSNLTGGATGSGAAMITGTLTNGVNVARTATYIVTPLSGSCTGATFTLVVTVTSSATINALTSTICSGAAFTVSPTTANGIVPAGTLYTWGLPGGTGFTGGATGSSAAFISGTLVNTTNDAVTATYIVSTSSAGCAGQTFTLTVTINPLAVISPMSTTICGGSPFTVVPADVTNGIIPAGTRYTWAVAPTPGIAAFSGGMTATLANNISGNLTNTVNAARTATYLVTPVTLAGCVGAVFSVTVNINPTAQITAMTSVICNGSSFTSIPANITNGIVPSGSTYTWAAPTGSGFSGGITGTGSTITGTLANATNTAHSATYIVTPTSGSCTGNTFTIVVTVNPIAAVTDMTAITCSGVAFSVTPVDVTNGTLPAGTMYTWSTPVAAGITGAVSQVTGVSNITGILTNTTTTAVDIVYTITPTSGACTGAQFSVTVTVNPSAAVIPMSTTICGGSPFVVTPTNLTDGRVPPATTYSWLSLPTPVGVGFTGGITATGSSNITGTLLNTTNAVRTATYTVTPLTGNCTGAVFTVTVNINPLAQVTAITNITCSGTAFTISPANLTNGIVPSGTTYSWIVDNVTGGLTGAATGSGQAFISGTLTNPTNTQQTATYTVTPITVACGNGATFTVTVSVNPAATITDMTAVTCGGVAFTATPTVGTIPAGTRYAWSLPTGTGFSGGASATNALSVSGTLVNTTNAATTVTYTVNTLSGACAGAPFTLTVTLNPKAIISQMTGTTCSGTAFAVTPVNIVNNIVPSGTTYTWITPTGSNLSNLLSSTTQPDINGILTNNVNVARTATYTVTPLSGSCTGNVFSIVVTVNPGANITAMTNITCSGVTFAVSPVNVINGIIPGATLYSWAAPSITGSLTGFTGSGSSAFISGTLINTSNVAQTATYTVTPTSACGNGPTFTVTVTVNPAARVNTINTATCSGITFTVTPTNITDGTIPATTTYTWGSLPVVTGGITGGATRVTASATVFGLLTNPTNTVQTATYTVTPLSGNCTGAQFSVVVTLNPIATISPMTTTVCGGTAFAVTPSHGANGIIPSGTTYQWLVPTGVSVTGGASATGSATINGTLGNTSNIARTATYLVIPTSGNCTGAQFSVTVTLNPTPVVVDFLTISSCGGLVIMTPAATIIPAGITYTWPTPTGSGYSGGQAQATPYPNFYAVLYNTTSSAQTATYVVTPSAGSCIGATITMQVSLKPVGIITAMTAITCSGVAFSASPVDGTNGVVPAGTTYGWTLPSGSGFTGGVTATGQVSITGTLVNTTNAAITATYIVTPKTGTCSGATFTITVTIDPAAYINPMTAVTCAGTSFSVTPTNLINGIVPAGTTYAWSSPSVTGTLTGGAAMSGVTNINGTLSHTNTTAQTATYTVTPYTAACGYNATFTVTVIINPLAAVIGMTGTACNGVAFAITPADATNGVIPPGTVYTWATPTGTGFTGGISQVTGISNINGILTNTTSSSTTVTYLVTPGTASCFGAAFSVTLTLNPAATVTPMSTSICSSATFIVTPSDGGGNIVPAGTTYSWSAPSATGITGAVSGSGASSVSGTLINTTSIARTITYIVTTLSGSCTGNVFTVTVVVDAKASVNALTAISSSNAVFTIIPADVTNGIIPAGTTYSWPIPSVTGGITGGAAGSAITSVSGSLFNPTNSAQTATYTVTPLSGNCTGATFTVTVTINPLASVNALTVTTCSGVAFSITPTDPTNGTIPSGTTYTWSPPTGAGFTGGASGTSQSNIGGNLTNTTTAPVTATYIVTPSSGGFTGATFTVTVTVNPIPVLSSTLTPAGVCSGSAFSYTATTATAGSVLSWSRTTVTGITSGGAATGTGDINQTLFNSTTSPVSINYVYSITANGCTNPSAGIVTVAVNPIPVLNSTLAPADIYNATVFNYTATSLTPGTTFAWSRAALAAINSNTTGSGVGATISETLTTTNPSLTAIVYAITLTANGCVNAQTITVNVSPTPALSSTQTPAAICSGTVFGYTATSATPATTFTWTRAAIATINGNATGSGITATINEVLTNSSNVPVSVVYTVMLTANTFTNTQNVTVVVNPTPSVNQPVDQVVCNGSLTTATIFSGSVAGSIYTWTNSITAIGLAGAGSGTINAFTATNSTTATVTSIITVTPMSNSCAGAPASFSITVYPTPVLSSTLTPTGICTGSTFAYTPTTATAGTTFSWSRTTVSGITLGGPSTGTGNITGQSHINNTTAPLTVQYVYSISANACPNIQTVSLAVNPTPVLTSTLSPTAVFGGTPFVYTATSATPGTTYSWTRATLPSIDNAAGSGTGTISEILYNNSAGPALVTYTITLTANGCSNVQSITATINQNNTPLLPGIIATPQTICTGLTPLAFTSTGEASGGAGPISYQWQVSMDNVTFTDIAGAVSAGYAAGALTQTTYYRRAASTSYNGSVYSGSVKVTILQPPVISGGIIGVCAASRDSVKTYSVLPALNATNYVWTIPAGWSGSSFTNTIDITAGSTAINGNLTVTPFNGTCAGSPVSFAVAVIDYAKVTLTASPSTVKGDGIATSQITIQLFDPNGNPIHCSGGTATLCTSSGVFSDVIDNGDGTYTGYLRSSANSAIICGSVAGRKIEQTITTTFTGPQGSIKGNGPIFDTETPLLTFNFTAGIGPFTVIYKPQGATKTDTLTNVVSNVPVPVKSIDATKLYTMVSIIGSDNARRDNNFTRDTATILVVAPKIIITLTADAPKFVADNMYSTILRMKVTNIGNIDLASVQVRADLTNVFPNPVQFILDSVRQAGVQTVPNNRYDGINNLDLFSWNSKPGMRSKLYDNIASATMPAMAYGNAGNGYTGLNGTDGAADDITQIPFLPGQHATEEKENTTGNDGPMRTPFFYGALSKLDAGEESSMQLYVRIIPNGYYKPFVMQAIAVGTGHTEFGTSLANSLSNDDGNEALHPENTHNGDPLPTVINVFPNPVLGVAMNATTPVLQGNGTYNVTLNYLLKNYGNVNLRQVKLFEELTRSIGSPATFSIVSAPVATGNLIANPSYNGTTDTSMLAANSMLGVSTDATVTLTINITPNQLSALYRAFAIGTGFNTELGNTITDISSNGTNPDPDGNEIPDERLITLIPINMSIPPLVPGTIGIQDTPTTTVLTKAFCGTSAVTVVPNVAPAGGVDPYTYQWQSSADNVTFVNITGATGGTYTGTIAASIYLRRIVVSGNQEAFSNSVHVVINTIAKPVITASGSLNLTQSGSITLTSSGASAYLWSTNATTSTIAVSTAGAYTVTVTDANGCKATSGLVAINPPPPTTVNRTYVIGGIGNPANSGVQVTGLTGATLKYYLLSTGGTLVPVPVLPGVIGTYPYYVSQVVNGYESVLVPYTVTMIAPSQLADLEKITSQKPALQADGSYIVNFTIRASNVTTLQLDSVKIKDDLRAVFPTAVQFDVVGVKTSGKLIANELYNGNTQIELLADGSVIPASQKDSVILTVKVTPNGFSGQLKNTATQVAKSPYGVFSVTSNDPSLSNGLTSRAPTEFIIPATDIFIPSGFSPNRDGVNDVFVITRPFNTTINMEIYNRWGNLVYRSRDYKNDWGGKGNQPNNILGEDLPDGTYYYVVLATDNATGNVRKFAAFITLKR